MKKIKSLIALATFVIAFSTCMEDDPRVVPPEEPKPEPTPVGIPIGTPNSKIIGASGGTISSLDGTMMLEIPEDALGADTEISIQPITNFAPNGNGNAYQLGPEGTKFTKPIKVTFKHGHDISATVPPLTGIAFQKTDGIWYSAGGFTWDETNKTVSTETMHFSGWAMFDDLKVVPKSDINSIDDKYGNLVYKLSVNESAEFELIALANLPLTSPSSLTSKDNELTPLVPQIKDNELGVIIKAWSVNGDVNGKTGTYGTIAVNGRDSVCTYTAPAKQPEASKNPVQLSVDLRNLKYEHPITHKALNDLIVSTQIQITGDQKYTLTIASDYSMAAPTSFHCILDEEYRDTTVVDITVRAVDDVVILDEIKNSTPAFNYNSDPEDAGSGCTCLEMTFKDGSVIEYTGFKATIFKYGSTSGDIILDFELTYNWCPTTDRYQCLGDPIKSITGPVFTDQLESGEIILPRSLGLPLVSSWNGSGTITIERKD